MCKYRKILKTVKLKNGGYKKWVWRATAQGKECARVHTQRHTL